MMFTDFQKSKNLKISAKTNGRMKKVSGTITNFKIR